MFFHRLGRSGLEAVAVVRQRPAVVVIEHVGGVLVLQVTPKPPDSRSISRKAAGSRTRQMASCADDVVAVDHRLQLDLAYQILVVVEDLRPYACL
jgi:hypothetical protein